MSVLSPPSLSLCQAWDHSDDELTGLVSSTYEEEEELLRRKREVTSSRHGSKCSALADDRDRSVMMRLHSRLSHDLNSYNRLTGMLMSGDPDHGWDLDHADTLWQERLSEGMSEYTRSTLGRESGKAASHLQSRLRPAGWSANRPLRRSKRDEEEEEQEEEEEIDERSLTLTQLTFVYEDEKDGNVFTASNLRAMAEFEYSLYHSEAYQNRYCRLFEFSGLRHCQQFFSILRLFDGTYSSVHDDLFDPSFTNVSKVLWTAHQEPDTSDVLKFFLSEDAEISSTKQTIRSRRTRSTMTFGYPLQGFNRSRESRGRQSQLWSDWAFQELVPVLMEKFESGINDLTFLFYGTGLYWQEALRSMYKDLFLLIGSFAFIFLFMWFQTGSLFVTTFGILSIFTSFFGANLIYNIVIGYKFFGIFNVLALFIILGIGADDIFIYSDTWRYHLREDFDSLEQRLSSAFKRASVAMFVTSLTSMVAFFINSFSPMLSISAFGSFAGLTVLVNYVSVITYFPAAVTLYHRHFEKNTCCCCCSGSGEEGRSLHSSSSKASLTSHSQDVQTTRNCTERANATCANFFGDHFFRFVTHRAVRVIILVVFTLVVVGAGYLASTIQLASDSVGHVVCSTVVVQ